MRGPVMAAAVLASVVVTLLAPVSSATRHDSSETADALQAIHEAVMAGVLGSAEVQYPNRPSIFKSPVELRKYLDALNAYYAIAGRPRFGKRGSHDPQRPEENYDY